MIDVEKIKIVQTGGDKTHHEFQLNYDGEKICSFSVYSNSKNSIPDYQENCYIECVKKSLAKFRSSKIKQDEFVYECFYMLGYGAVCVGVPNIEYKISEEQRDIFLQKMKELVRKEERDTIKKSEIRAEQLRTFEHIVDSYQDVWSAEDAGEHANEEAKWIRRYASDLADELKIDEAKIKTCAKKLALKTYDNACGASPYQIEEAFNSLGER